jgi:prevent-host-death family protein
MSDAWKLQDAKARFSELVRRAKAGQPQIVTLHGKDAVVVSDATRFNVTPKAAEARSGREFIEACKKYRGAAEGIDFESHIPMQLRDKRREIFDGDFEDENKA